MNIQEDLPFAWCQNCPECVLKCEQQVFLSDHGTERRTVIRCKNASQCRKEQTDAVLLRAERSQPV